MNISEAFRKAEVELYPKPTCQGLFFRGYSNTFWSCDKYETKRGMRLLKRKSCKGFEKCDSYDEKTEDMRCDHWFLGDMPDMIDIEAVIMPEEVEDGALYSLRMTNVETDWETGHCDHWDYEFFKVEDDKKKNNRS